MPRLFFVTDVHGSDRCFRKFLNAAPTYKAEYLILGGDITGKVMIPIVETSDSNYSLRLFGRDETVKKEQVGVVRRQLQDAGQYSFLTNPKELAEIQADFSKQEEIFNEAMISVLVSWLTLANERLKGKGVKCFISPGNDDKFAIDEVLKDSGQVVNPEGRVVELETGHEMITLGYVNPTPWKSPREVSEEKLGDMIESLASGIRDPQRSIYNLHVPPIDTEIDKAPAVSEDLGYVREGLGVKTIHAGSAAVRAAIEVHQPLLGLHGHIHESRGLARIARTVCVNPGSEYSDGILRGCLVDLKRGNTPEVLLTSG